MMKRKLLALIIITIAPFTLYAQFGGIANKVRSKVTQRADAKVDKAIDKTLDKAEGKEKTPTSTSSQPQTQTITPAAQSASTAPVEQPQLQSFSKYDFIPGEEIIYYENFEQETIAELPMGWNTSGSGEVVTLNNIPGKWLRMHKSFVYLTSNEKTLPENYTMEFDVVMQLKNNGWMFPEFSFGIFSSKGETSNGNNFLREYKKYASVIADIAPAASKTSRIKIQSIADNKEWFRSDAKTLSTLDQYYGKPIHVAIQVQKERFRIWINEEKAFDIPKGVPLNYKMNQFMFQVGFTNYAEEQYGMYISNIKTATGKADTRHKLINEGKFSTTAILFDVNSATIKPESAGVLKEIAEVLKENSGIKIKIIGHTDNDGTDAANLTLSQKRAAAVKDALVSDFGIDASGIETDGKGESKPVADNKTKEGKAANRRVEFIKIN
ncbi:MAG: OmpA family protein [Ferruginibacter sp.]